MDVNEKASPRLTFRDFIVDKGETAGRVDNLPKNPETWEAIRRMANDVVEPLIDYVGEINLEITYGFCSPARAKLVRKWWTNQKGDQHVGHETNRRGNPICPRLGFAVDLRTPSSLRTALFIVEHLDWDRIYFYGDNRPLHVSIAPKGREPARVFVDMRNYPCGGAPPKVKNPRAFLEALI